MRSVIFLLIKTEELMRSLSCKNPFCAIVKGLRFSKASEEQIPTAMSEETAKRVNCHKNGNLPLFCIEKDTRNGVLYAPFACVLMVPPVGVEPTRYHYHRILSPSAQPLSRANEESERHERKRVFRHEGGGRGRQK